MTHFIVGVIALVLGVCGMVAWWDDFGELLRGFVPIILILVGLAGIGAGIKKHSRETESEDSDETPPPDQED